jgi:lipoyl(octanoyl) transferase
MVRDLRYFYNIIYANIMTEWLISKDLIDYSEALSFMDERVAAIREGEKQDLIWLLEHAPLYTAGTSANDSDLLTKEFPVYKAGRGGQYTYHGPGQRIAYVMLDLKRRQNAPDVKQYVWQLEEWIIRTLAELGVTGERRCGRVGIWVDMSAYGKPKGVEAKIAAIGVRIRRWVTLHGIAINNNPDLSHFGGIVPCGISEHGVTSLKDLGVNVTMADLDKIMQNTFEDAFAAYKKPQSCAAAS